MTITTFATWLTLVLSAAASPLEERASCSSYTIINTRGTGEPQGPSVGFTTMNANVLARRPGGKVYNTVYPAAQNQNFLPGTEDIVNHINSVLATNPNECFILEGYSQGAAATTAALSRINGPAFNAVKGVFMIGNPFHKSGLPCNVDNMGGDTTRDVNGIAIALSGGIPGNWISKSLDVCIFADGVCDTTHGNGVNAEHLEYPSDANTQKLGTNAILGVLQNAS